MALQPRDHDGEEHVVKKDEVKKDGIAAAEKGAERSNKRCAEIASKERGESSAEIGAEEVDESAAGEIKGGQDEEGAIGNPVINGELENLKEEEAKKSAMVEF